MSSHRESMFDLDLSFLDNHSYDHQLQMEQHHNNMNQQQQQQQQQTTQPPLAPHHHHIHNTLTHQHQPHYHHPNHYINVQHNHQISHDFSIANAASTANSAAITAAATAAAGAPATAIDMFNSQLLPMELGGDSAFDFDFDKMQNNVMFDPHHGPFVEETKHDDLLVHPCPPMSATAKATTKATKKQTTTKPKNAPKRQYRKRKSEGDVVGLPQSPKKKGLLTKTNSAMSIVSNASSTTSSGSPRSRQTSTFRGVSCCGKDRKFQARIRDANRVRYLGRFATEVEAALVYDASARSLKGSECPTNFIALSAEQEEELKRAFVQNGYRVPEHLSHWVRSKNTAKTKAAKKSAKRKDEKAAAAAAASAASFPDSPIAKVRATAQAPMISPKSTSKRASPLANTVKTFASNPQKTQPPQPQVQQQQLNNATPMALSF